MEALKIMDFRIFSESDFKEYLKWFNDERIRSSLFNIDSEWLKGILNDNTGIEYAIYLFEEMVGEVGIVFPTEENPYYVISNIAIKPSKFRTGIGTKVLNNLYELHPLKEREFWVAYVEEENKTAQRFFEKNGWVRKTENDMIRYEKRKI